MLNANPLTHCKMTQFYTLLERDKCFFQLPRQNTVDYFVFKNNSANAAGSVFYGGAIDDCQLTGSEDTGEVFNVSQYGSDNTTSSISSDPFCICLYENNYPDCSKSMKALSIYPGETIQLSVVAVGQRERE